MRLFNRKLMVGIVLNAFFSFILPAPVRAGSGDADGIYTVDITKIEISSDSGSNYTTIYSGSSQVNIASASAGATVAGLASGVPMPPATYNAVRSTVGSSLLFKGYVTSGGTTYYTDGGTDGGAFSGVAGSSPGSDYATSTFTIDAGSRTQTETGLSIVCSKGVTPTVTVEFDTSSVLSVSGTDVTLSPPVVDIASR